MEPAANAVAAAGDCVALRGNGGATLAYGDCVALRGNGGATLAYGDCVALRGNGGATLAYGDCVASLRTAALRLPGGLPPRGQVECRANALHANTRQPADGRKALSGCIHDTLWLSRDVRRHGPRPPAALPKPLTVMDIRTFQRAERFRLPGRRPPSVPCPQPGAPALSGGPGALMPSSKVSTPG